MKIEIERKFLVAGDEWRELSGEGRVCEQGYISTGSERVTVRVRSMGGEGFLTLKGASEGIARPELEYKIPVGEAEYILKNFCGERLVFKKRYRIESGGLIWEIDEFSGRNRGLVLAEIELENADRIFLKPAWLGEEVSCDPRYRNASLAVHPFCEWGG